MNKRKKSKVGLLVILVIFVYFAYTVVDQQKLLSAKDSELKNIQMKIDEQQKTNEDLKKHKEVLHTDENVERIAREKLGMIKQGERVFVDINK